MPIGKLESRLKFSFLGPLSPPLLRTLPHTQLSTPLRQG